jgi:hypothetical protein
MNRTVETMNALYDLIRRIVVSVNTDDAEREARRARFRQIFVECGATSLNRYVHFGHVPDDRVPECLAKLEAWAKELGV